MTEECEHDWRYNHQVGMIGRDGAHAYQVYVCRKCDASDYREIS